MYREFTGPRNPCSTWPHRAATCGREEIMREFTSARLPSRKLMLGVAAAVGLLGAAASLSAAAPNYTDWSAPVNLGPTINTTFNESGPALSKDGLSLYFNSNRPGGFGGHRHLGLAARLGRRRLGSTGESGTDDQHGCLRTTFPAFSRDGHWMFFASDRRGRVRCAATSGLRGGRRPTTISAGRRRSISAPA